MNASFHGAPALALAVLLTGCGGTIGGTAAFSMSYPDNHTQTVEGELRGLSRRAPADATLAVGVTSAGDAVVAFDPATGTVRFRVEAATTVPPILAGRRIVVEHAGHARILDATSGRDILRVRLSGGAEPEHVIGADEDQGNLALTISSGTGTTARSRLVIVRGSDVETEVEVDRPIGVPSVVGSRVLVPWAYQFLSILDLSGSELARIRIRSGIVGHVMASPQGVWFGGESLFHLNPSNITETPSGYRPPSLPVDRLPNLFANAYEPPAPLSSAARHVKFLVAPDPEREDAAPADGVVYLVHYRFVFALDATSGVPRWVRFMPADVVGAAAFAGGIRVAAESGETLVLDAATGRAYASAALGETLSYVGFPRLGAVTLGEPIEGPRPDVRVQLLEAVQLADSRLVAGREFALSRLALLEDDDATADLGLLCEDESLPARTKQRACELLARRPVGAEHVQAQLARHGSFLAETPAPPVASLARAAGTMRDAAAVPLLLEHLDDPRTSPEAIQAIADALLAIGDAAAVPRLRAFLFLYHADIAEPGMSDAFAAVANAFVRLGGDATTADVDALARDPFTPPAAVRALREPGQRLRSERGAAEAAAQTAAAAAQARETASAPPEPSAAVPTHLTHELAEPVLGPAHDDLAACLDADPARAGSARVIVMVRRNGTVADVHTTPSSIAPCLRNRMQPLRFPETRGPGATTRLTFTLRYR